MRIDWNNMIRRTPPNGVGVIPGCPPVVAFGRVDVARVATLGLNPSKVEYLDTSGALLQDDKARLPTLAAAGAERLRGLTDDQVTTVRDRQLRYFDRRPYRRWFDQLDRVITGAFDVSYYDGSACHLDLVQWATAPTWSSLGKEARCALLAEGRHWLEQLLARDGLDVVVVNGRSVIDAVVAMGLVELNEVAVIPMGHTTCRIFAAKHSGQQWIGWSTNLQSSLGVTTEFREALPHRLTEALT
ncbi:hypothetical protein [Euzebya pacifica]|uniref:hypothetical protein n=1 Tax=Euzebya pacifica TaxID=1608957 RepID=UPI0030F6188F